MPPGPHYLAFSPEDYEHILRALITYDAIRGEVDESKCVSSVQMRWFDESERLGLPLAHEDRDRYAERVLEELDAFVEGEVWEELAWWVAEREAKRRSAKSRDRDAIDLITHRYYHEVMEEFNRHGIDHLNFSDITLTELSPGIVRSALEQYRVS